MNELRSTYLLLPLLLSLAVPAAAQRDAGSKQGRSAPSAPRQAPAPAPRQAPAPAPRQAPAPQPASRPAPVPTPRSAPRPVVTQPTPRATPAPAPQQPAPRAQPSPRSQPTPTYGSTPGASPRSQPAPRSIPGPRPSTRNDIRVSPAAPPPTPTTAGTTPPSTVGGRPRADFPRPTAGGPVRTTPSTPSASPPPRPSTRDLYEGRGKVVGATRDPVRSATPIDARYQPTRPTAGTATPRPNAVEPRPRSTTSRPVQPAASDRYTGRTLPRDTVPDRVATPRVTPRAVPTPVAAAPRLVSRPTISSRATPTLQHRSLAHGVRGPRFGAVYDPWSSWWDPCHDRHYGGYYGSYWGPTYWGPSLHCGHGAFSFHLSFWEPWWYGRSYYWNRSYADCWWRTRSSPCSVSSSYWWYPTTTYCPTYLTVPSSTVVVMVDDHDDAVPPAEAPAPAPAPTDTPAPTPPAGGGIADRTLPPSELARKYVELGDFYFQAGRFPEAADAYARARGYAPDDASVHFVLADAAFASGDYPFAAFLIGEALRLDPSMATADTDKRLFYGDPKAFEEQMAMLEKHLASKPYDAQAQLVRGYNLRFSGQPVAAVESFRRVLEIAPENRAAATFLAMLTPTTPTEATAR